MKTFLMIALVLMGTAALSSEAFARGRTVQGGNVVHSRRAPVVLHRAVPPFHGVHVYGGR